MVGAYEVGARRRPLSGRWEALVLGILALLFGVIAVWFSGLNSHASNPSAFPNIIWQALTACAVIAGLGAVAAFVLSSDRWRPLSVVGSTLGLIALVATPIAAFAVRPHPSRAIVYGIDGATGRILWKVSPSLVTIGGVGLRQTGIDVVGVRVGDTCAVNVDAVTLMPSNGHQYGSTRHYGPGGIGGQVIETSDATSWYHLDPTSDSVMGEGRPGAEAGSRVITPFKVVLPPSSALSALDAGSGVVLLGFGYYGPKGPYPPGIAVAPPSGAQAFVGVRVYDELTSKLLWSKRLDSEFAGAVVDGGTVWTLNGNGRLTGYAARTGRLERTASLPSNDTVNARTDVQGGTDLWRAGNTLVTITDGTQLVGINETGAVVWTKSLPPARGNQTYIASTQSVLAFATSGSFPSLCNTGGE